MSTVSRDLKMTALWEIFERICAIPHDSGNEAALVRALGALAESAQLAYEIDGAGNLIVNRPGVRGLPRVIVQAHLDMVWQSQKQHKPEERNVRFHRDGMYLTASPVSTLGADDGIGVAAALALLLDPPHNAGDLRAILTVGEETGLYGAQQLDPKYLDADYLFNLDSETEGEFYLGCAGYCRTESTIPVVDEPTPLELVGIELDISGLPGGHSGIDIDKHRPNAILEMAQTLLRFPGLRVAEWNTVNPDNAIPRASRVVGAGTPELFSQLPGAHLIERPARVWTEAFRRDLVSSVASVPNGVFRMDNAYGVVSCSGNLASLVTGPDRVTLIASQRALVDKDLQRTIRRIEQHFDGIGGKTVRLGEYCGWEPAAGAALPEELRRIYQMMFGVAPEFKVIHAGLECGLFSAKNPRLQMVSFGPTIENPHSPSERVHIGSVEKFYRFLRGILREIA